MSHKVKYSTQTTNPLLLQILHVFNAPPSQTSRYICLPVFVPHPFNPPPPPPLPLSPSLCFCLSLPIPRLPFRISHFSSIIHTFIHFLPTSLSTPVSPTPTPPPPRPLFSLYLPLTTDLIQCRPGSIGGAIGRALWCFYFFGSFLFHLLFQNFYGGGIKAGPANKSKGQNEWKPFFLVERHRLSGPSIFENIFFHTCCCHMYTNMYVYV